MPGGAHQFYTGVDRDPDNPGIPAIANGMDIQAITGMFMKQFQRRIAEYGHTATALDFDTDEMNRLLAEYPEDDRSMRGSDDESGQY